MTGGPDSPLRVAIIGSGPSGFYVAQHLLASDEPTVEVDLFDRLPTPFGLVRYGVAPDHQKDKSVTKAYARTAAHPRFRFFGNVELGSDVSVDDLRARYHQIVYTVGAQTDRRLGIPGEDLGGSHTATEFVAWYNGHPDFRDREFDLSCERAIVVGMGNVAIDVARILSRTMEELEQTDIAADALEVLRASKVREVVMLGRRGPAQAAFTTKEVRELGRMAGADGVTLPEEMELDPISKAELEKNPDGSIEKKLGFLNDFAKPREAPKSKRVVIRFLVSPAEILGDENDDMRAVNVEKNELYLTERGTPRPRGTGEIEEMEAGILFRSVGYRGVPISGVPFRDDWGIVPNDDGRVLESVDGERVKGEYVCGWIKRGPSGVIGTNKVCARGTVAHMMEDLEAGGILAPTSPEADGMVSLLESRGVRFFSFADWTRLDEIEMERGAALGRPRLKFLSIDQMKAALDEG